MPYQGLFIGATTLDVIYKSDRPLPKNKKVVALDYLTAAGGPATNAAVAFSYFNNRAKLLSVIGQHPIAELIKGDLNNYSVEILDLAAERTESPPISSIVVTANTGERAVIATKTTKYQNDRAISEDSLNSIDIILIDGHQIEVSLALAKMASDRNIPVVMDGGSWKLGLDLIIPLVDYAICSANFYPPGCHSYNDVFNFIQDKGIAHIAITNGERPIQYLDRGEILSLAVSQVDTVDTLGAGDIFHGAFCHYILQSDFPTALSLAAKTASKSCQFFGTRTWLQS